MPEQRQQASLVFNESQQNLTNRIDRQFSPTQLNPQRQGCLHSAEVTAIIRIPLSSIATIIIDLPPGLLTRAGEPAPEVEKQSTKTSKLSR